MDEDEDHDENENNIANEKQKVCYKLKNYNLSSSIFTEFSILHKDEYVLYVKFYKIGKRMWENKTCTDHMKNIYNKVILLIFLNNSYLF